MAPALRRTPAPRTLAVLYVVVANVMCDATGPWQLAAQVAAQVDERWIVSSAQPSDTTSVSLDRPGNSFLARVKNQEEHFDARVDSIVGRSATVILTAKSPDAVPLGPIVLEVIPSDSDGIAGSKVLQVMWPSLQKPLVEFSRDHDVFEVALRLPDSTGQSITVRMTLSEGLFHPDDRLSINSERVELLQTNLVPTGAPNREGTAEIRIDADVPPDPGELIFTITNANRDQATVVPVSVIPGGDPTLESVSPPEVVAGNEETLVLTGSHIYGNSFLEVKAGGSTHEWPVTRRDGAYRASGLIDPHSTGAVDVSIVNRYPTVARSSPLKVPISSDIKSLVAVVESSARLYPRVSARVRLELVTDKSTPKPKVGEEASYRVRVGSMESLNPSIKDGHLEVEFTVPDSTSSSNPSDVEVSQTVDVQFRAKPDEQWTTQWRASAALKFQLPPKVEQPRLSPSDLFPGTEGVLYIPGSHLRAAQLTLDPVSQLEFVGEPVITSSMVTAKVRVPRSEAGNQDVEIKIRQDGQEVSAGKVRIRAWPSNLNFLRLLSGPDTVAAFGDRAREKAASDSRLEIIGDLTVLPDSVTRLTLTIEAAKDTIGFPPLSEPVEVMLPATRPKDWRPDWSLDLSSFGLRGGQRVRVTVSIKENPARKSHAYVTVRRTCLQSFRFIAGIPFVRWELHGGGDRNAVLEDAFGGFEWLFPWLNSPEISIGAGMNLLGASTAAGGFGFGRAPAFMVRIDAVSFILGWQTSDAPELPATHNDSAKEKAIYLSVGVTLGRDLSAFKKPTAGGGSGGS